MSRYYPLIICLILILFSCQKKNEKAALMHAIDAYESAWAVNDFLTVESFFAEDAKRLHTEPYVWDRAEIKRYFEERADTSIVLAQPKSDWRKDRDYLDIRIEGNIAYDIFTTKTFKALHIWEKQNDGTWKIIYDVGFLHHI